MLLVIIGTLFGVNTVVAGSDSLRDDRPNFVLFMVDDLGYGDIASFGNKTLSTPHIDALAVEGARLTHTVAASAMCTPSRSAFLTGRYPVRYGLDGYHVPVIPFLASSGGLPTTEITFAKALQLSGYSTALIGKWHQGLHCTWYGDKCHHPHNHGFEYFYGTPFTNHYDFDNEKKESLFELLYPNHYSYFTSAIAIGLLSAFFSWRRNHRLLAALFIVIPVLSSSYIFFAIKNYTQLNSVLMRNDEIIEQPLHLSTLTKRYVDESVKYIKEHANKKNPFLLFLSFNHVHVALEVQKRFKNSGPHGIYGDAIRETDWAVGQVADAIKQLGLDNTMFFLTSDHGAHIESVETNGEMSGGSNHPFSGGKSMFGMEGGIRVPAIFSWPGKIPANVVLDAPTTLMDIFPTLLNFGGVDVTKYRCLDGYDLSPLLTGKNTSTRHKFIFHYGMQGSIHSVRYVENDKSVWKVHFFTPRWLPGTRRCAHYCDQRSLDSHDPPLVYNVISDPAENNPLSPTLLKHKEIVDAVLDAVTEHKQKIEPATAQLDVYHAMWRVWLQPCCNFPYCSCREYDAE